jgi:uncharacterized membrane protein
MAKRLILIFSLLLLFSCASRKVDVSKTSTEVKVDSSVVTKVDGTYVKDNNVFAEETIDEVEYKPLDSLKPMVINGKSYINTVIKSKKKHSVKTDKTKAIAKVSSVKKLNVKREGKKESFEKHVKKETNYWMYLWFLIPIIIIWLLEKYGKTMFPFLKFFK